MDTITLTFSNSNDSKPITKEELNHFENSLDGLTLPDDYRKHMLDYNGGIVDQDDIEHKNYPSDGVGIAFFLPIKYGGYTIEKAIENYSDRMPSGYLAIGYTTGCAGVIIMSLNNDETYGYTKVRYTEGEIDDLSPSFTDLLNDMVESYD